MDKDQKSRFSKAEMELIRSTFIEDKILYAIRKVMYQFDLTDDDKNLLKSLSPDAMAILKKVFIPEPIPDAPLLQEADLYFSLSKIKEINPGVAALHIYAKDLEAGYLEQQFNKLTTLEGPMVDDIVLKDLKERGSKSDEIRVSEMMAYLSLTNAFIDSCLNGLKNLANSKDETPEQIAAKAAQNSSK